MNPTKEFIKLCQKAAFVQKEWKPEAKDRVNYPPNKHELFYFLIRNFESHWAELNATKKDLIFLPDAAWCVQYYKEIMIENEYSIDDKVFYLYLRHKGEFERFEHTDYDTVHLLACEFILSGGKNNLIKGSK